MQYFDFEVPKKAFRLIFKKSIPILLPYSEEAKSNGAGLDFFGHR